MRGAAEYTDDFLGGSGSVADLEQFLPGSESGAERLVGVRGDGRGWKAQY
ncbi:unannotated protein [freshwater metagenome]|uniref:Unannotated protein n=1 Tax=freshwater metagenome TaxID=449393 RepID=A0A6J5YBW7_9ZZZZ